MKKIKTLFISLFSALFILISAAFITGDDDDFLLLKNLEIFQNILKYLRTDYVYKINPEKLITDAINSMLKDLDPYTNYYSSSQIEQIRLFSEAKYTGIGIITYKYNDEFYIIDVLENSPAQKAGLKIGDKIVKVNNVSVKGKTYQQVHNLITGDPGTYVTLTIQKLLDTNKTDIQIQRQNIKLPPIDYSTKLNNIGYIKLVQFSDNAYENFAQNLKELLNQNISGLIIDLRDNPGGLLNEAVNILSLFFEKNTFVVAVKGKNPSYNKSYFTSLKPLAADLPIVVLVNKNSASASEIVSGAIQDYDRGVIIGEQTVGKGLVQRTVDVGYNSILKLTIAHYYTPSGRCIQAINYQSHKSTKQLPDSLLKKFYTAHGRTVIEGKGILPDIKIDSDTLSDFVKDLISKHIIEFFASYYIQNFGYDTTKIKYFSDFSAFEKFLNQFNYGYTPVYLKKYDEFLSSLDSNLNKKFYQNLRSNLKPKISDLISENEKSLKILITAKIYWLTNKKLYYEVLFQNDKYLIKAFEILNNNDLYKKILNL